MRRDPKSLTQAQQLQLRKKYILRFVSEQSAKNPEKQKKQLRLEGAKKFDQKISTIRSELNSYFVPSPVSFDTNGFKKVKYGRLKKKFVAKQMNIFRLRFPQKDQDQIKRLAKDVFWARYKKAQRETWLRAQYKKRCFKFPKRGDQVNYQLAVKDFRAKLDEDPDWVPHFEYLECVSSSDSQGDFYPQKKTMNELEEQDNEDIKQRVKNITASRLMEEQRAQQERKKRVRQWVDEQSQPLQQKERRILAEVAEDQRRQRQQEQYSNSQDNARLSKPAKMESLYKTKDMYKSTVWRHIQTSRSKRLVGVCYDCWKYVHCHATHQCHPDLQIKEKTKQRGGVIFCGYSRTQLYGFSYQHQRFIKGHAFAEHVEKFQNQPGWACLAIPRNTTLNTIFKDKKHQQDPLYIFVTHWLESRFALRGRKCIQEIRTGPFSFQELEFPLYDSLNSKLVHQSRPIFTPIKLESDQHICFDFPMQKGDVIGPVGGDIIYSDFDGIQGLPTEHQRFSIFPFTGATILSFLKQDPTKKNGIIRFASNGLDKIYAFIEILEFIPAGCTIWL